MAKGCESAHHPLAARNRVGHRCEYSVPSVQLPDTRSALGVDAHWYISINMFRLAQ